MTKWEKWEVKYLRENYPRLDVTAQMIAEKLGRSENAVILKANRLDLEKNSVEMTLASKNGGNSILIYSVIKQITTSNSDVNFILEQEGTRERLTSIIDANVMHNLDPLEKRLEQAFCNILSSDCGWDCFWYLQEHGATTTMEIFHLFGHPTRSIQRQMSKLRDLQLVHVPTTIDDEFIDQGSGPKPYVWALKNAIPRASKDAWLRWREFQRRHPDRPGPMQTPLDPEYEPIVNQIARELRDRPTQGVIIKHLKDMGISPKDRLPLVPYVYGQWKEARGR